MTVSLTELSWTAHLEKQAAALLIFLPSSVPWDERGVPGGWKERQRLGPLCHPEPGPLDWLHHHAAPHYVFRADPDWVEPRQEPSGLEVGPRPPGPWPEDSAPTTHLRRGSCIKNCNMDCTPAFRCQLFLHMLCPRNKQPWQPGSR